MALASMFTQKMRNLCEHADRALASRSDDIGKRRLQIADKIRAVEVLAVVWCTRSSRSRPRPFAFGQSSNPSSHVYAEEVH